MLFFLIDDNYYYFVTDQHQIEIRDGNLVTLHLVKYCFSRENVIRNCKGYYCHLYRFGYTLYCKQCRLKFHLYSALNWTNCEILPARNACWLSNHMNITCSSYRLKQGERLSPHHSNLFSIHYHSCYWSQFLSFPVPPINAQRRCSRRYALTNQTRNLVFHSRM